MKIRMYENKDWDRICDIFDCAKQDEMKGSCDLRVIVPLKEDENFLKSFHESVILVAENEGVVVGFCGYCGSLISWLMVDPKYYRQGIGSKLLEKVLECVGEKAYLNVAKYNGSAQRLYFGKGFKMVMEYTGKYNGYEAQAMKLALKPELKSWE